jgi:4-aminobutyrate--pyruvate transaminase
MESQDEKEINENESKFILQFKSNNPTIELATKLLEVAPVPMSKVIFQNSGSEAVDTAIKLVWYYQNARGKVQ